MHLRCADVEAYDEPEPLGSDGEPLAPEFPGIGAPAGKALPPFYVCVVDANAYGVQGESGREITLRLVFTPPSGWFYIYHRYFRKKSLFLPKMHVWVSTINLLLLACSEEELASAKGKKKKGATDALPEEVKIFFCTCEPSSNEEEDASEADGGIVRRPYFGFRVYV